MKKVKCAGKPDSHFFDADRFHICPICGAPPADSAEGKHIRIPSGGTDIPPTVSLHESGNGQGPWGISETGNCTLTPQLSVNSKNQHIPPSEPQPITMSAVQHQPHRTMLPVGWLIGIGGKSWGKTFECRTGRNRIGNKTEMDIVLPCDNANPQDIFAVLIFEPKRRMFYIESGNSAGQVYLNDEPIYTHAELQGYDKIRFGESTLLFLPLCGESFTWDDYINKE